MEWMNVLRSHFAQKVEDAAETALISIEKELHETDTPLPFDDVLRQHLLCLTRNG